MYCAIEIAEVIPAFGGLFFNEKIEAGLCASEGCFSSHISIWKEGPVERKEQRQKEHFRTVFVQSQGCLNCGGGGEDRYFTRAIIFP